EGDADAEKSDDEGESRGRTPHATRQSRQRKKKRPGGAKTAQKDAAEDEHNAKKKEGQKQVEDLDVGLDGSIEEEPHDGGAAESSSADHANAVRGHDLVEELRAEIDERSLSEPHGKPERHHKQENDPDQRHRDARGRRGGKACLARIDNGIGHS